MVEFLGDVNIVPMISREQGDADSMRWSYESGNTACNRIRFPTALIMHDLIFQELGLNRLGRAITEYDPIQSQRNTWRCALPSFLDARDMQGKSTLPCAALVAPDTNVADVVTIATRRVTKLRAPSYARSRCGRRPR